MTAQRSAQKIQSVPVAVSVLDQAALEKNRDFYTDSWSDPW